MSEKDDHTQRAYAAADEMIAELPVQPKPEQRDTFRRVLAIAYMQGWADARQEEIERIDARIEGLR